MTKNELIAAVADKAQMTKTAASAAVDACFDAITLTLKKGGEVKIMGFGNFRVVKRAAREGRDGLPGHRPHGGRGRDRRPPHVRHADLREDVRGLRCGRPLAATHQGFIQSSSVAEDTAGNHEAFVILRVPSSAFGEVMLAIKNLANRLNTETVTGEDLELVRVRVVDTEGELDGWR